MQHFFVCLTTFVFTSAAFSQTTSSPTPEPVREEVTVTINRTETRLADTSASVVTLKRTEIIMSAAPTLDDVLRQTAGFSIFRRSSSRNANPTTQGVSLRGVGASGASRSVVLFDGVPLGDVFGGWIQWNRVPAISVETVEVLRGGASSLYGSAGLSGAINIIPRRAGSDLFFSADIFGGMQKTASGSIFTGLRRGGWSTDLTGSNFQTKGYRPVEEAVRGPVDVFAGVRSNFVSARLGRVLGERAAVFFRPSYFGEVRTNGTPLQTNRTHIRQFAGGGDFFLNNSNTARFTARGYGGTQVFDQIFTAVSAARTAESLTRVQRVPAQSVGATMQLSAVFRNHTLVGGADIRNVRGASDEIAYFNNRPASLIGGGGRESSFGVFGQDFIRIGGKLVVSGSLRYDRWRNYAGLSATRPLAANAAALIAFPDRVEDAFSPQIAALYRASETVSIYANASRAFRAPTLNELYRAFRVGNVLTLANENLRAERSNNIESGISYNIRRYAVRGSVFWTRISDTVANVTLASMPDLITRQRQNAAATGSQGVEIEGDVRLGRLFLRGGYLFADSRVREFPTNPQLAGLRIPQVARHQFTFQARYSLAKWFGSAQFRASGSQFDDDLNVFRLEPYGQMDMFAGRLFRENLTIYGAVENILNSRYSIGRTPVRTVSSPANFRIGLRWR